MKAKTRLWRRLFATGGLFTLLGASIALVPATPRALLASPFSWWQCRHACGTSTWGEGEEPPLSDVGGTWYWLRSPEEEKRVVMGLFNRYCIRCHGVDGRGVWDIPGVPNFTSVRWQESRSDAQRARIILEGRGAVMPPFRGALSLEEAWAIGRYLRTLVPGSEVSRPDFDEADKPGKASQPAAK
jgi:hypothetical protein